MIKEECKHIWEKPKGPERVSRDPSNSPMLKCAKCNILMPATVVYQIEALENQTKEVKHLTGFQKWVWIVTIIISIVALVVSILTYAYK